MKKDKMIALAHKVLDKVEGKKYEFPIDARVGLYRFQKPTDTTLIELSVNNKGQVILTSVPTEEYNENPNYVHDIEPLKDCESNEVRNILKLASLL